MMKVLAGDSLVRQPSGLTRPDWQLKLEEAQVPQLEEKTVLRALNDCRWNLAMVFVWSIRCYCYWQTVQQHYETVKYWLILPWQRLPGFPRHWDLHPDQYLPFAKQNSEKPKKRRTQNQSLHFDDKQQINKQKKKTPEIVPLKWKLALEIIIGVFHALSPSKFPQNDVERF